MRLWNCGVSRVKSALKYSLKDIPELDFNNVLKENVKLGNITPETAAEVSNDIVGYKNALGKVGEGLSPEAEASVAGLIQHRTNLEIEAKSKDETQQPFYEEKIKAVNEQIKKITESNDPYPHEIDEVTGKPLAEKPSKETAIEVKQDYSSSSDAEIEKRMAAIEGNSDASKEYNDLEKEMQKREREAVFNVPLGQVKDAADVLLIKE